MPFSLSGGLDVLGDLLRELARGADDEGLNADSVRVDAFNQRDAEGQGLAGPRLCFPDDVPALHEGRNGLFLDRCGRGEALPA